MYTISEAAQVSTKSASAIRSTVDRGDLPALALIRAGIFNQEGHLPLALRSLQDQLNLFQDRIDNEIDGRLTQLEMFKEETEQEMRPRLEEFASDLRECQAQIALLRSQLDAALAEPAKLDVLRSVA